MSEIISAQKVSFSVASKNILAGVSFTAAQGELHVILGKNGSGKTTFFNILTGSYLDFTGHLAIKGTVVKPKEKRRFFPFGIIFQNNNLISELTVVQNVVLGRVQDFGFLETCFYRVNGNLKDRAMHILEVTGLADLGDQKVAHLSGGERQRAAIARALMQDSEIILADEPVSALDPRSAEQCMELLRRAKVEFSKTVLVILHQLHFAREFGEKFTGFSDGRVVFGNLPPSELDRHVRELY